ncbi:MAG TPA: radical SAM protein [Syntrophales bacterium]|nr:radical SAM protein [Syntrophales bacterium]
MIIPFFLPNRGCPQRCLFCNQSVASGEIPGDLREEGFHRRVRSALDGLDGKEGKRPRRVQIAFYGGNFTGLSRESRRDLLQWADMYLRQGSVDSIRVSTRPDHLDAGVLDEMKSHGVTTVEVGLQSLKDAVLDLSRRGHTAADGERAVGLLKERGFETSVHLMAGLPGDSPVVFDDTVRRTAALEPDMVRLHPTIVLRGTALEEEYRTGRYRPLTLAEAVELCAGAVRRFSAAGIPVIRLGLQPTPGMTGGDGIVAGPFHPAFGSLVHESLFRQGAATLLERMPGVRRDARFRVAPGDVSFLRGQRNGNLLALRERFRLDSLTVEEDAGQARGVLVLESGPSRSAVNCLVRP